MGRIRAPGSEAVHRGPHPRGPEIQRLLGRPCGRREAGGSAAGQAQGGSPAGGAGGPAPPGGPDRRANPHAPDEHPLCARPVPCRRGGHGGGAPAGHRPGGVPLFQRAPGGGGQGGEGLLYQPGSGDAAVRLPDFRLCQPVPGGHPAGPFRPGGGGAHPVRRRRGVPHIPGGGGLCGGHGRGAPPPAHAGQAAPRGGLHVPAAAGPAGLCPVCPRPLPLSPEGLRPERRHGGGHPGNGGRPIPHSRHLSEPGGGNGLYEPEADRPGGEPSAGRLGAGPAR